MYDIGAFIVFYGGLLFSLWVLVSTIAFDAQLTKSINLRTTHLEIVPNMWDDKCNIYELDALTATMAVVAFLFTYSLVCTLAWGLAASLWPAVIIILSIAIFIANKQIKHNKTIENEKSSKPKERNVRNDDDVPDHWTR